MSAPAVTIVAVAVTLALLGLALGAALWHTRAYPRPRELPAPATATPPDLTGMVVRSPGCGCPVAVCPHWRPALESEPAPEPEEASQ